MRTTLRAAVSGLAAFGILTGAATGAWAELASGDPRATAYPGNVQDENCEVAGLDGEPIGVTSNIDETNTYLDITAIPDGWDVTGVVVKASPAYNLYLPENLGDLPWLDLHAPLNASGKPAEISHWLVCATETPEPSPSPSPSESSEPSPEPSPSESPAASPEPSPEPSDEPTEEEIEIVCELLTGADAQEFIDFLMDPEEMGEDVFTQEEIDLLIEACAEDTEIPPAVEKKIERASPERLADTGSNLPTSQALAVATMLILAGGGLVYATRRRAAQRP